MLKEIVEHWQRLPRTKKLIYGSSAFFGALGAGYALGKAASSIDYALSCQIIDSENVVKCTDLQIDVSDKIQLITKMLSSKYASERMKGEIRDHLDQYEKLNADPKFHLFWFEAKEDDRRTGLTSFAELNDGDAFLKVQYPKSHPIVSADDLGTFSHEGLSHLVDFYRQYKSKDEKEVKDDELNGEYRAAWFGYYIKAIALKEGMTPGDDLKSDFNDFGTDTPEVVYQLDKLGYDADSPLWKYIFDSGIKKIDGKIVASFDSESDTAKSLEAMVFPNLVSSVAEARNEIKEITKRWEGFPAAGSAERTVLINLINQGLIDETFLPSKPVNFRQSPTQISRLHSGASSVGIFTSRGF